MVVSPFLISRICLLIFFFGLNNNITLSFQGRLYAIDQSTRSSAFVQILNNSTNYNHLLNLGDASFSGPANAMKTINNNNYIVTYYISDSSGVPHYYILTIDLQNKTKIKSNITINAGQDSGSFWQIADDEKAIFGIRESMQSGASLELATIDRESGRTATRGLYPYGSYSLIMAFARQRRLYYNVMDSNMFYGINVDTGSLDINLVVPNDDSIYALVYDSLKDRLISLVYSPTIVSNAWILLTIDVNQTSSTMKFQRIGKTSIPMQEKYLWSTTYTLAVKERQWFTLWTTTNDNDNTLIIFDIDTGEIIEKQIIKNSNYLNNFVYFD